MFRKLLEDAWKISKQYQNSSASTSNLPENEEQDQESCQLSKRLRFDEEKSANYCIICCISKYKGDTKLYRISERHSAKTLLSAACFFKDDV